MAMADGDIHNVSYHVQDMSYGKVTSDELATFRVNLRFLCNYVHHDFNDPVTVYSVNLNLHHVSEVPKARETIQEKLSSWKLSDDELDDLASYTVQEIVKLTSSCVEFGINVLNLDLQVTLEETNDISPIMEQWFSFIYGLEESAPSMVPATDESIMSLKRPKMMDRESLKRKRTTVDETCVICLEDFSEACDTVYMPCEHEFHGDCIEKWLKTSHYCPTCRFEMPTN